MPPIESDISSPVLEQIIGLVYRHTGITMTEKKKILLQGRLRPRLKELSLDAYADYLAYFADHPDEAQTFINLVTTNETLFFRTKQVWDHFRDVFLPEWWSRNPGRCLRIWSAAASSGEEAYTIAMVCHGFQEKYPGFQFRILGTDISTEVLEHAKEAVYSGRSILDLNEKQPGFVDRYFSKESDGAYRVRPELRAAVRFGTHSLFNAPAEREGSDIVFLRNVMIYFNVADQEKVLRQAALALPVGGTLILGESESLVRFQVPYDFVAPLIYRRKAG